MSTTVGRMSALSLDSPAFVPFSQRASEPPTFVQAQDEDPAPFDQHSDQWEWTPDPVGVWEDRGLEPKYHRTVDGNHYVFALKSVPLMNKAWKDQEAESFLTGIEDLPHAQAPPGWNDSALSEEDIAAQEEIEQYLASMSMGPQPGYTNAPFLPPSGYGSPGGLDPASWDGMRMFANQGGYVAHNGGMVGSPGKPGGRRDMYQNQFQSPQHTPPHSPPRASPGRGRGQHHLGAPYPGSPDGQGRASVLSAELTAFVASLGLSAQESKALAMGLRKARISSIRELASMRWNLTSALGIDIALASIVSAGLGYP